MIFGQMDRPINKWTVASRYAKTNIKCLNVKKLLKIVMLLYYKWRSVKHVAGETVLLMT